MAKRGLMLVALACLAGASVSTYLPVLSLASGIYPAAGQPILDGGQWFSTQLHVHGWSNHNATAQPASLQMHSDWARDVGLDVLWWSEHNSTFDQNEDVIVDLASAVITNTLDVSIPLPPGAPGWSWNWYVAWLKATVSGDGQPAASLDNGMLEMSVQDDDATPSRLQYRALDHTLHAVEGQVFPRPLVSQPVLGLDLALCSVPGPVCSTADGCSYAEIRVGLSWHDYGGSAPEALVYRFVPADASPAVVAGNTTITYTVPVTGTRVELPLLGDAGLLLDGDDNVIQELYFSVGAREGATGCMRIGNLSVHSHQPEPTHIFAQHQTVAARHESTYGVIEHTGWEQFAGVRHLNAYLPSAAALIPQRPDIQVQNFVPLIHGAQGLVGLNHPFGAGFGPLLPPADQEQRVQQLLDVMLPNQGWGADLIEIYKNRAGIDLEHYLRFWELLAVNGVPLCAVSASDLHGGPFNTEVSSMVSWIQAPSAAQDDLLEGLRACRVFFGDLLRFDGTLDLALGLVPMGGVYPVRPGAASLLVTVDPLPSGAQVRLVQILDVPGRDLTYLVDHQSIDPSQPVLVDVSQPSFLRVEVWSADGQPMAFSNMIRINACDIYIDGHLNIADVQMVAGLQGQSVPPAPQRADLRRDGMITAQDLILAAQCRQAAWEHVP